MKSKFFKIDSRIYSFIIIIFIGLMVISCSSQKNEIINSVKNAYKFSDIDYKFKVISVSSDSYSIYDRIAWVEIEQLNDGKTWRVQMGRNESSKKWEPTLKQLTNDMNSARDEFNRGQQKLDYFQKQIEDLQKMN